MWFMVCSKQRTAVIPLRRACSPRASNISRTTCLRCIKTPQPGNTTEPLLCSLCRLGAGGTNFIYENREVLSLYAKAYLAQTLFLLDPEDKRIASVMSDLGSASVLSASGAHWEEAETDYWNWNTDTRTTAIVLNPFVQIDPQNPITANAVRWLMAHRNGGHWYSTQETTWSLIALTNWLVESKEYETDYKYAIGLNGELLQGGQSNKDNLTEKVNLQGKS